MSNQFQRLQMLIGEKNLELLNNKKVAVFGIGGVGGNVCDALARSGIGNFILVDYDTIDETNINRQLVANYKTLGMSKVSVMKDHILSINPQAKIEIHKTFFLPENQDEFNLETCDYVVDAIDTVTAKIALIVKCKELNVPIISSMGAGNKLNPTMLEVVDIYKTSVCPLARVMRYELKKRNIKNLKVVYSKEKPLEPEQIEQQSKRRATPGSSAFVPPVAGIIIASEIVKDLISK